MGQPPTFRSLGSNLPASSSLITGGLLSLSILASFPALMRGSRPVSVNGRWTSPRVARHSKVQTNAVARNSANIAPPTTSLNLGRSESPSTADLGRSDFVAENHEASSIPLKRAQKHQAADLDSTSRHQVILEASEKLKLYYFDHALAEMMSLGLLAHEKNGDDDYVTDPENFAHLLTTQLRDVSDDRQLE